MHSPAFSLITSPVPGTRIRVLNERPTEPARRLRPLLDDRRAADALEFRAAARRRAVCRARQAAASSSSRSTSTIPGRTIVCTASCWTAWPQTRRPAANRARSTTPTSSQRPIMAAACCSGSRSDACTVVTDHFPAFFIPRLARGGRQGQRRARRGRRFEWPDPAGGARARVHVGAIVSRVRPARASFAPARRSPRNTRSTGLPRRPARLDPRDSASDGRRPRPCSSADRRSSPCRSITPSRLQTRSAASGRPGGVSPLS